MNELFSLPWYQIRLYGDKGAVADSDNEHSETGDVKELSSRQRERSGNLSKRPIASSSQRLSMCRILVQARFSRVQGLWFCRLE